MGSTDNSECVGISGEWIGGGEYRGEPGPGDWADLVDLGESFQEVRSADGGSCEGGWRASYSGRLKDPRMARELSELWVIRKRSV